MGQIPLAKSTEQAARAADPKGKIVSIHTEETLKEFIGHHDSVVKLKEQVRKLQCEPDSVLITGESGTGKELIARALHGGRTGRFVGVNCTALPSELIESELFGHKKGAFTGADSDRVGRIQSAWQGTLFLDEIGDMPLEMQSKLLRVLQEKKYCQLGSDKEIEMDCRVVAATWRKDIVNTTKFRLDLFMRLATFELSVPSLLERYTDIDEIVDHYGGQDLVTAFHKKYPEATTHEYYQAFFDISGNVRSLQRQVRRYQVLGEMPK